MPFSGVLCQVFPEAQWLLAGNVLVESDVSYEQKRLCTGVQDGLDTLQCLLLKLLASQSLSGHR